MVDFPRCWALYMYMLPSRDPTSKSRVIIGQNYLGNSARLTVLEREERLEFHMSHASRSIYIPFFPARTGVIQTIRIITVFLPENEKSRCFWGLLHGRKSNFQTPIYLNLFYFLTLRKNIHYFICGQSIL